jgi:hypothetical protein
LMMRHLLMTLSARIATIRRFRQSKKSNFNRGRGARHRSGVVYPVAA